MITLTRNTVRAVGIKARRTSAVFCCETSWLTDRIGFACFAHCILTVKVGLTGGTHSVRAAIIVVNSTCQIHSKVIHTTGIVSRLACCAFRAFNVTGSRTLSRHIEIWSTDARTCQAFNSCSLISELPRWTSLTGNGIVGIGVSVFANITRHTFVVILVCLISSIAIAKRTCTFTGR